MPGQPAHEDGRRRGENLRGGKDIFGQLLYELTLPCKKIDSHTMAIIHPCFLVVVVLVAWVLLSKSRHDILIGMGPCSDR